MRNCIDPAPPAAGAIGFGEFPVDHALGVMLAHTLNAGNHRLKKGRTLDAGDIATLKVAGIATVTGVRPGPDEAGEDAAAAAVAALLAGHATQTRKPATGRCNLHAETQGVLVVDAEVIVRLNRIDESIGIGTLPPWSVVRRGQVVATVKIIPLGIPRRLIEACREALASQAEPPLRIAELTPQRVALILTELPDLSERSLQATREATRRRIEALGSRLALELRCPHEPFAVESALRQAHAAGCELVMICGASGTKDRRDTVGAAIVAAGGRIDRFGLPVEPGNMLLLGRLGEDNVPLIVMPGCARSRRLSGLDWVLQRLLARLPLEDADFAAMGVGGLIRTTMKPGAEEYESAVRSMTTPAAPTTPTMPGRPRIAALILAAGRASRMGGSGKLLERIDGIPLVLRAINAALASCAESVTVVTGHDAERVAALAEGRRVNIVRNPDHAQGMASSLKRGIAALPADIDGVLVMLGDMPFVSAAHLDALIDAFADGRRIVAPVQAGRRGNPVLWPQRFLEEFANLEGDRGARDLLEKYADQITAVEFSDAAIFVDVDTPQDLHDCNVARL